MQYIASITETNPALPETDKHQPSTSTSGALSIPSLPDDTDGHRPSSSTSDELPVLPLECYVSVQSQEIQVNLAKESTDFGCQVNTYGDKLMKKSSDTQTPKPEIRDASTQFESSDSNIKATEADDIDENIAENVSPVVSPHKDPEYQPSSSKENWSDESETSENEEEESCKSANPQDDTKFLVFKSELFELFKRCHECGAVVTKKHHSTQGTQLFVTLTCINGHTKLWKSQPMLEGMAAGNLLMSSSILLSGSSYTKVALLAEILNLNFF